MNVRQDEVTWMKRALAIARRARGDTCHYPMVGAVVVKNGRVIAEAYFHKPGQPHAEALALKKAGKKARNADLVLNLEPCSHHGKTPPCADAVIEAGIRRVVAGMVDPNPLVAGRGIKKLKAAGIEVVTGVLEDECQELNRAFVKYITTQTPYVVMKAAATMDGKIATRTGDSFWVSGEPARKEAHRLRDVCQAVMVGAGTIRNDDCELTVRLAGKGRHPRPVVVTDDLDLPLEARFMATPAEGGPVIFCTKKASPDRVRAFQKRGAEVVVVKKGRKGGADLGSVMRELGRRKIASVLVEGGAGIFGSALRAGLVDELVLFLAPKLLSGEGISVTSGDGPIKMADAIPLSKMRVKKVGNDLMVTARITN